MTPPLLLIHGGACNARHFTAWADFFARRGFDCVVPDLPGHGADDADRLATVSLSDYLAAMRAEVARLAAPPIVIGHSMGGLVAQMLAAVEPCRALVCVASAPPWMLAPQLRALPYLLPLMPAILRGLPISPAEATARELFFHDLPAGEREKLIPSLGAESGRAFREMIFGLARLPASRFSGPVLCLSGARDRVVSPGISKAIAEYYSADYEIFDAGHWLIAESAVDRIAARVLHWIERRV